ncbi:hypothetical protein NLX86_19030 [Streptomyces sp. A3M-1-3]|uniref:hypothetical protein n=1 Tax=Streptomyces sp. A3M-1-3 TaxID=2962044 RepID=UPI0020B6DADD|nr:hypothetical protein [Streptomyces sp. A3M-1-3]MCP3820113.1 hypothetical protein [Streptomyces sp. A3M-1-3]
MSAAAACAAWVGGIWLAIAIVAWNIHRRGRRPAPTRRTPADVARDAAAHRAARTGHWQINDAELADQVAIWADDFNRGCDRLRDAIRNTDDHEGDQL